MERSEPSISLEQVLHLVLSIFPRKTAYEKLATPVIYLRADYPESYRIQNRDRSFGFNFRIFLKLRGPSYTQINVKEPDTI
jgi:hypothetical protein